MNILEQIHYTHRFKRTNCLARILPATIKGAARLVVALDHGSYEVVSRYTPSEFVQKFEEIEPWEHLEIDAPIEVQFFEDSRFVRRHFAGVDKLGRPTVWEAGFTSYTTDIRTPFYSMK